MSLPVQNLYTNPNTRLSFYLTRNSHLHSFKAYSHSLSSSRGDFANLPQSPTLRGNCKTLHLPHWPVRAYQEDGTLLPEEAVDTINLDAVLSVLEFLCLATSAVVSIGLLVKKSTFVRLGNTIFAWQLVLLIVSGAIGAIIRSRQWRKLCNFSKRGGEKVNLVERIEKLEEDVSSSVNKSRALSRQLEKLGTRFRVTRKAFKDPIAQAAVLAQKNSEAIRALSTHEDILEKELSEIQKILLAMQEQQQKQLELILAIGKTGKLLDKRAPTQKQELESIETHKSTEERPDQITTLRIQSVGL